MHKMREEKVCDVEYFGRTLLEDVHPTLLCDPSTITNNPSKHRPLLSASNDKPTPGNTLTPTVPRLWLEAEFQERLHRRTSRGRSRPSPS